MLGMLGLGCNLRYAHVLFDGEGALERALATIDQRWAEATWVSHRTSRAIAFARDAIAHCATADGALVRLDALTDAVTQLAGYSPLQSGSRRRIAGHSSLHASSSNGSVDVICSIACWNSSAPRQQNLGPPTPGSLTQS